MLVYPQVTHQIAGNTSGATANVSSGTYVLAGGNNITLSQNANSVTISAGGGGAAGSFGMSNLGNTTGTSGTVSGLMVFVGSNGIGLSQSTNGGSATLTIQRAPYLSNFMPMDPNWGFQTLGNGSLALQRTVFVEPVTCTMALVPMSISISSSSNSSHGGTLSLHIGIYTLNGSTLSLASSGSQSWAWTNTSNNSLTNLASGRLVTVPLSANLVPGQYYIGVISRTSTVNANWWTGSVAAHAGALMVGYMAAASVTSAQLIPGMGHYTATTAALPSSIGFNQIQLTAAQQARYPFVAFHNVTY